MAPVATDPDAVSLATVRQACVVVMVPAPPPHAAMVCRMAMRRVWIAAGHHATLVAPDRIVWLGRTALRMSALRRRTPAWQQHVVMRS